MSNVIKIKTAGGKITGVTFWGISDDVSWVKENNPLLFSRFNTPKSSYYKVLQAYTDAGLQQGSTGSNNSPSSYHPNEVVSVDLLSLDDDKIYTKKLLKNKK